MPLLRKNLDLNEQFVRALEIMENTSKSIFITGRAGTGKSTLLDYFRRNTRKKVASAGSYRRSSSECQRPDYSFLFPVQAQYHLNSIRRIRLSDENKISTEIWMPS
jgi:dephospho-CoA kinase